jgi:hypothetical protein
VRGRIEKKKRRENEKSLKHDVSTLLNLKCKVDEAYRELGSSGNLNNL